MSEQDTSEPVDNHENDQEKSENIVIFYGGHAEELEFLWDGKLPEKYLISNPMREYSDSVLALPESEIIKHCWQSARNTAALLSQLRYQLKNSGNLVTNYIDYKVYGGIDLVLLKDAIDILRELEQLILAINNLYISTDDKKNFSELLVEYYEDKEFGDSIKKLKYEITLLIKMIRGAMDDVEIDSDNYSSSI